MTLIAEQVAHAQARIRELIESGKLAEATAFARVNGIEEEWAQECYAIWRQRQAKAEEEKPLEESWITKFRRLKLDTETERLQIDAALKASGMADDAASLNAALAKLDAAKAEPRAEPKPEPEPQTWDVNPPMLSRASPLDSARLFAKAKLYQLGALATYYHRRHWWQWNGRFYAPIADDRVTESVTLFLDSARTADGEARFKPKSRDTEELVKALRVHCLIEDAPPQWLDGREDDASSLLVFRNCLVDCETGRVAELTPELWAHGGVDIDYEPHAQCPRWKRFLEEVFPGDAESQQCIEEQLGYGMTRTYLKIV